MKRCGEWLWGFVWFRYACVVVVHRGPQGVAQVIMRYTPMLEGLRELFLSTGDLKNAALCRDELQRLGHRSYDR